MTDELKHVGVIGMHWGLRRYQNPDGTLTPLGKERYRKSNAAINVSKRIGKAGRIGSVAAGATSLGTAVATGALIVAGIASGPIGQAGLAATLAAGVIGSASAVVAAGSNAVEKYNEIKIKDMDTWTKGR